MNLIVRGKVEEFLVNKRENIFFENWNIHGCSREEGYTKKWFVRVPKRKMHPKGFYSGIYRSKG
jgi:hypothetical protein